MALLKECGGYVGGKVVAKLGDEVAPGLAVKNQPKKTRPIKPEKPPKNPPQSGVFGFYWVFLNLTSTFCAKVTVF
jgi:hypothetical protein